MRILRHRLLRSGFALALGCFGICATRAPAKFHSRPSRYRCDKTIEGGGGTLRVNQFTIEVKFNPDNEETPCQALIRSPKGKTVFRYEDWAIDILSITGKDVNGDGQPDAVIESFSGGAHCCSTYSIVSLGKKPGLIRGFGNRATASFEDLKGDGRVEILVRDGGFDGIDRLSHAFSPFPLLILRLEGDRFKDVGAEFWKVYDKEINQLREEIKAPSLDRFLHQNPAENSEDPEFEETKPRVLLIVLDYLYSGRPKLAWKSLDQLWPAGDKERIRNEILQEYCTGFRTALRLRATPACKDM